MGKITDFLNKIWPWFQKAADKIRAWDLPKPVKELFDEIEGLLDESIKTALYEFIKANYEKYGRDFALQLLDKVLRALKLKVD